MLYINELGDSGKRLRPVQRDSFLPNLAVVHSANNISYNILKARTGNIQQHGRMVDVRT